MVTKAGKKAYGLDRFCSSVYGKPVPGLSCCALSLMSLNARRSYPIQVEQMRRTEAEKAATHAKVHKHLTSPTHDATRGKPGRPQGSKHRAKTPVVLRPELQRMPIMIQQQLAVMNGVVPLCHLV